MVRLLFVQYVDMLLSAMFLLLHRSHLGLFIVYITQDENDKREILKAPLHWCWYICDFKNQKPHRCSFTSHFSGFSLEQVHRPIRGDDVLSLTSDWLIFFLSDPKKKCRFKGKTLWGPGPGGRGLMHGWECTVVTSHSYRSHDGFFVISQTYQAWITTSIILYRFFFNHYFYMRHSVLWPLSIKHKGSASTLYVFNQQFKWWCEANSHQAAVHYYWCCGSVMMICLLMHLRVLQELCQCRPSDGNCSCCKECMLCLGNLWEECCDCVGECTDFFCFLQNWQRIGQQSFALWKTWPGWRSVAAQVQQDTTWLQSQAAVKDISARKTTSGQESVGLVLDCCSICSYLNRFWW